MQAPPIAVVDAATEISRIASLVKPVVEGDDRVNGLHLFGSRARGTAHEKSDCDLGVLFSEPVGIWEQLALEDRLELALECRVDLVDLGQAKPYLALDIIRGERVFEADGEACDRFDLYVMRRAADLAPFERMRREMVLGWRSEEPL